MRVEVRVRVKVRVRVEVRVRVKVRVRRHPPLPRAARPPHAPLAAPPAR